MPFDSKWNEIHKEHPWALKPSNFLIKFFDQYYPDQKIDVLDIGCANGASTLYLAEKGHRVTAVDGSEAAIQGLMYNLAAWGCSATVGVADITKVDLDANQYDCIIAMNVLECLTFEELKTVISNIYKWLRPNGRFFSKSLCDPSDKDMPRMNTVVTPLTEDQFKELINGKFEGDVKKVHSVANYNGRYWELYQWIADFRTTKGVAHV